MTSNHDWQIGDWGGSTIDWQHPHRTFVCKNCNCIRYKAYDASNGQIVNENEWHWEYYGNHWIETYVEPDCDAMIIKSIIT